MANVPEETTSFVTVAPKDDAGLGAAPSSGNYRVHDVESGDEILGTTAMPTLSASMKVTMPGATINKLVDKSRAFERRRMTVELSYGAGDPLNGHYIWTVEKLTDLPA